VQEINCIPATTVIPCAIGAFFCRNTIYTI
jgi:hypothetical protein